MIQNYAQETSQAAQDRGKRSKYAAPMLSIFVVPHRVLGSLSRRPILFCCPLSSHFQENALFGHVGPKYSTSRQDR